MLLKIILSTSTIFFLATLTVYAQESPNAGDACVSEGITIRTGGTEEPNGEWLVCDGTKYVPILNYNSSGRSSINIANDIGSCTSDKLGRLRYNDVNDTWQYCDGSAWGPFEQAGGAGCGFSNGTCPPANSSIQGCLTKENLTWGAVSCTTNGALLEIDISNPQVNGNNIGDNDSTGTRYASAFFCNELGLQNRATALSGNTTAIHYWYQMTNVPNWLYRPSNTHNYVITSYCVYDTSVP